MDMIIVTDWDKVDKDDFYLSNEWLDEIGTKCRQKELKKMARNEELFLAYEVAAVAYAIYSRMDASQIFIDGDGDIVLDCESVMIGNSYRKVWEVE